MPFNASVRGSYGPQGRFKIASALPITDYSPITNDGRTSFSYVLMPGSPRTLLNYITSFGISQSSQSDGGPTWNNAYATLNYVQSPVVGNNYFTRSNRVRIIDGDGSADGPDWCIFNFDVANGSGDYDGNSNTYSFFGGENSASGGSGGGIASTGKIWGFSETLGWKKLFQLPLGQSTQGFSHLSELWWTSGTTVTSGNGKRAEYDNLQITHIGFSV